MNREETERYINAVVTTAYWLRRRGAEVKFMYPALYRYAVLAVIAIHFRYRTTCRLDIRFFPYDQQNCTLTISSWTSSKSDIDYLAEFETVNLDNFISNEEWVVVSFTIVRVEVQMLSPIQTIRSFAAEIRVLSRAVGTAGGVFGGSTKTVVLHR